MDATTQLFKSGVINLLPDEDIPDDAAQDALGFITKDGKEILVGGRINVGTEGTIGQIRGLWYGYTVLGTLVLYRKIETKLQYLLSGVWTDILTGLTSGSEASFANYSSLAGAFTFFVTVDGYWKINNAHPGSAMQMYDATKNFHGKIFIDKGRTILYDHKDLNTTDNTGLYGSHIDPQNATVYTQVTSESIGSSGSTNYSGTLAFTMGGATRNAFGVQITATVVSGTETFSDNFNGILTSNKGGTGTINYATGAYNVTFASATTGSVTANYQWEDSNIKGLTDFTKSATRLAGEGFIVPQDNGGDAIMKVLIGQDGAYYSIKQQSAYQFLMDSTDLNPTNEIYYQNMGMPSNNAAVSTQKGILFLNTSNPDKPEMTILQKNPIGDNLLPVVLFPEFKFSNYDFSDSYFDTWERYVVVSCKQQGSVNNDRILLLNISDGTVDISPYNARMFAKDGLDNLFVGSPVTQSVYQIYSGFDDMGLSIQSYWISKASRYIISGSRMAKWRFIQEELKKFRRFRIKGLISPEQVVQVYISYDEAGFQLMGTIVGSASYVDYNNSQAIGTNFIGQANIGGSSFAIAYNYFAEIKIMHCPKFRKRIIKFVPTGIGYFDFAFISDWDIELFENRLPKRFRQKQLVSMDGLSINQP